MNDSIIRFINNVVESRNSKLLYTVNDLAPSTENALFNSTGLVIWNGASDSTIFQDPKINYKFRALHDLLHLQTRIGFSPSEEIELGRIQANQFEGSDLMRELVYCEVALQAEYYQKHGKFVENQIEFTINYLTSKGII
jgi:hypothetical protein